MDFTMQEYKSRHENARKIMLEEEIDALITNDIANYIYFSGHGQGTWRWRTPHIVLLPKEGPPILVGAKYMEESMKSNSCISDVRLYDSHITFSEVVKSILDELNLSNGRIGVEFGLNASGGQRIAMAYHDFVTMMKLNLNVKFVDASNLYWNLRIKKSDKEIEYFRKSCQITSNAYKKLFRTAKKGMTEREISLTMKRYMLDEGADNPVYCHVHIWPGATYLAEPTERALKMGDILWMDAGAEYKGYKCDFGRMGVVGKPSNYQKEMYEYAVKILEKCLAEVKPGVKPFDLYMTYEKNRGQFSYPFPSLGHGLGLDVVEPPNLISSNENIIETNMILAIEPGAMTSEGFFKIEENLAVTENGYEILSNINRELNIIE